MARIRTVKPDFFTSPDMAALTVLERLVFIGLWTHVDDCGRCLDEPRLVHAALFPLDEQVTIDDVRAALGTLHARDHVIRYVNSGRSYLQVTNWHHQKIDRPSDSKLPGLNHQASAQVGRGIDEPSTNIPRGVDEASFLYREVDRDRDQGPSRKPPTQLPAVRAEGKDGLWDALEHELGPARTPTERGNRGRTRKELDSTGATAQEVHERCQEYRRRYPSAALTDAALRKHWSQLAEAKVIVPHLTAGSQAVINAAQRMGIKGAVG